MSKPAFTPGPWEAAKYSLPGHEFWVLLLNGERIPEKGENAKAIVHGMANRLNSHAVVDIETVQIILDLLNPLHGSLDKQISDERLRDYYETPPDREWEVTITNQMERDLTQAVIILENRLREARAILAKVQP